VAATEAQLGAPDHGAQEMQAFEGGDSSTITANANTAAHGDSMDLDTKADATPEASNVEQTSNRTTEFGETQRQTSDVDMTGGPASPPSPNVWADTVIPRNQSQLPTAFFRVVHGGLVKPNTPWTGDCIRGSLFMTIPDLPCLRATLRYNHVQIHQDNIQTPAESVA